MRTAFEKRAAFEALCRDRLPSEFLVRMADGSYCNQQIESGWIGYQAALEHVVERLRSKETLEFVEAEVDRWAVEDGQDAVQVLLKAIIALLTEDAKSTTFDAKHTSKSTTP